MSVILLFIATFAKDISHSQVYMYIKKMKFLRFLLKYAIGLALKYILSQPDNIAGFVFDFFAFFALRIIYLFYLKWWYKTKRKPAGWMVILRHKLFYFFIYQDLVGETKCCLIEVNNKALNITIYLTERVSFYTN